MTVTHIRDNKPLEFLFLALNILDTTTYLG